MVLMIFHIIGFIKGLWGGAGTIDLALRFKGIWETAGDCSLCFTVKQSVIGMGPSFFNRLSGITM